MGNLNVIILAGGESSRFWPLKEKNSYPFIGKTNIDLHIERFRKFATKIYLIASEGVTTKNNDIEILRQEGKGMAGSVTTALKHINPGEEILVLNANDYYDESLVTNFATKRESLLDDNHAMIVGYKTETYFPGGYLKLDGNFITEIIEKPGEGNTPSNFVNIVFHYFPKAETLMNTLEGASSDKDDVYEIAMSNMMKSGQKFEMLEYKDTWKTIKYPWHVLDVMNYTLDKIKGQNISPNATVSPTAIIKGDVIIEDGVKIFGGAIINGPVYLGKNTIVANGALVRHSIVGDNCVIGFATEVARSYFKSNVWLHKNYVGDSILENNISFGSNTVTGNLRLDEKNISKDVKDNKVDTQRNKLGAIVGSGVRVGINVNMMPGVSIGNNTFIGPNVNVEKDIEDNKFVKLIQNLEIRDNRSQADISSRETLKKDIK